MYLSTSGFRPDKLSSFKGLLQSSTRTSFSGQSPAPMKPDDRSGDLLPVRQSCLPDIVLPFSDKDTAVGTVHKVRPFPTDQANMEAALIAIHPDGAKSERLWVIVRYTGDTAHEDSYATAAYGLFPYTVGPDPDDRFYHLSLGADPVDSDPDRKRSAPIHYETLDPDKGPTGQITFQDRFQFIRQVTTWAQEGRLLRGQVDDEAVAAQVRKRFFVAIDKGLGLFSPLPDSPRRYNHYYRPASSREYPDAWLYYPGTRKRVPPSVVYIPLAADFQTNPYHRADEPAPTTEARTKTSGPPKQLTDEA